MTNSANGSADISSSLNNSQRSQQILLFDDFKYECDCKSNSKKQVLINSFSFKKSIVKNSFKEALLPKETKEIIFKTDSEPENEENKIIKIEGNKDKSFSYVKNLVNSVAKVFHGGTNYIII